MLGILTVDHLTPTLGLDSKWKRDRAQSIRKSEILVQLCSRPVIDEAPTFCTQAAQRGRLQDVLCLLESNNLDVDEKTSDGSTSFTIACRARNVAIMRALLNAGADAKQVFLGCHREETSAASLACQSRDENMLELLVCFRVTASDESIEGDPGRRYLLSAAARTEEVSHLNLI